ncbi:predicted protein [Lodderomyces elongisporus NRRL YB-4239]|uniref:Uncharacterized protein n=1 Tax=Lodderomyces elongisporus (strain ATCC 11503 / CBS 2605 / JCM 1781 / NBRC 1676 / NRRL YB-4239) TaxID=379508 RepID=A5DWI7_LODEL|nr:predicted protein [Lodderomyces elongisporus NRRL YB-4239]
MANRKSRKFFTKRPFFPTLLPSSSSSPLYSSSSSFHDVSTINIKGCKIANDMNSQRMKRSSFNKENIYNVENTEIVSEKDQQITTCRKSKIYKHSYHHSYNDIFKKGCGNNQFHLPKPYSQPSQYLDSGSSTRTGQRSDYLLNSEIFSSKRSSSLVTPCSNVEREQKKGGMGKGIKRKRKRKSGGRMGDSLYTTTTTLLKRQRGEQHDLMFAFPAKIIDDSSSRPKPLKRFKSKSLCDLVFPNLNFKI